MKLTGWYQGDQKPVRVGYYERQYFGGATKFDYWAGKIWISYPDSMFEIYSQKLKWRGVAK